MTDKPVVAAYFKDNITLKERRGFTIVEYLYCEGYVE
jgi:hypothetical protein